MERRLFVHVEIAGVTHFVGTPWTHRTKGRERATFEYDASWVSSPNSFALEPALRLGIDAYHTVAGQSLFGAMGDSAPDRWDRVLIQREERRRARKENRTSHTLGEIDNEPHSYLEIADALTQYGGKPTEDRAQLWRWIVFNVLISNTDDHLRNHGFLYEFREGWRLSPAYDLNPTPIDIKPRILSLAIDESDASASLDLAFEVAEYFGMKPKAARMVADEVAVAVSQWRQIAKSLGLSGKEIKRMESAFRTKSH